VAPVVVSSGGGGGGTISGGLSPGYVNNSPATATIPGQHTASNPTTSAGHTFSHALAQGDIGPEVTALQQFLNSHSFIIANSGVGSPGNETTYFGNLTRAALVRFQQSNNISPADGFFGPLTRALVNVSLSSTTPVASNIFIEPLTLGNSGNAVTALQELLANLGFLQTTPTGYYGNLTFQAVKEFQSAHQLEPVGSIGPQTRAALNAIENGSATSSTN
jgi:stage II sporulation protein D